MILLLDGLDRCGKDTQLKKIKQYFEENLNQVFHVLHYSNIKCKDSRLASEYYYQEMFGLIDFAEKQNINLILNRSHIGEYIYAPLYRNYSGQFIFNIEQEFAHTIDKFSNLHLFIFIDKPENLIKREDGLSFSKDLEQKKKEINAFKDAYERSFIYNKYLININELNENQVFEIIKEKIGI